MRFTTYALGAACAAALTISSAGMAMAGEVTGNGNDTPITDTAMSACAFSGLDDNNPGSGVVVPGEVQTFPQAVRDGEVVEIIHGAAQNVVQLGPFQFEYGCNAHLYPDK